MCLEPKVWGVKGAAHQDGPWQAGRLMTGSDVAGESEEVCVGQCGRVSISFKAHLTVVCPALCVTYTFQKSVLISHLSLTQAIAPGDSAGDPLP